MNRLIDQEPAVCLERVGPHGLQAEEMLVAAAGLVGLALRRPKAGCLEQGLKVGAILLMNRGGAGLDAVKHIATLLVDEGEGGIHAFLGEDARHLAEDGSRLRPRIEGNEALHEIVDSGLAGGIGLLGSTAKPLAFGRRRSRPGGFNILVPFPLRGLHQLRADARGIQEAAIAVNDRAGAGDDYIPTGPDILDARVPGVCSRAGIYVFFFTASLRKTASPPDLTFFASMPAPVSSTAVKSWPASTPRSCTPGAVRSALIVALLSPHLRVSAWRRSLTRNATKPSRTRAPRMR